MDNKLTPTLGQLFLFCTTESQTIITGIIATHASASSKANLEILRSNIHEHQIALTLFLRKNVPIMDTAYKFRNIQMPRVLNDILFGGL